MKHQPPQSGSVLFIILIAIALFAALSYAFTRGGQGNQSQLTDQQARMTAQEIISYGNTMADAVQKLKLRGCTDNQITFAQNNGLSRRTNKTPYVYNTNTPADGSCDVFSSNGGKVVPNLFPSGTLRPEETLPAYMDPHSFFISATRVVGAGSEVGAAGTDLLLWVGRLREEQCITINKVLGVQNPGGKPPIDGFDCSDNPFDGTYPSCSNPLGDASPGKTAFCNQAAAGNPSVYIFHQVLLAR